MRSARVYQPAAHLALLACSGKRREGSEGGLFLMREAPLQDMRWGDFKPVLADAVVNHLKPIQV